MRPFHGRGSQKHQYSVGDILVSGTIGLTFGIQNRASLIFVITSQAVSWDAKNKMLKSNVCPQVLGQQLWWNLPS